MQIHLIAVGTRTPSWVREAYDDYARRLRGPLHLELSEIEPGARGKGKRGTDPRVEEGERMLGKVPKAAYVVALDERGRAWSTRDLARQLERWMQGGDPIALLVGGPDGLSPGCRERADVHWSLSALTLPHAMVRVIVAEQLYRAHSILTNHPYHRD